MILQSEVRSCKVQNSTMLVEMAMDCRIHSQEGRREVLLMEASAQQLSWLSDRFYRLQVLITKNLGCMPQSESTLAQMSTQEHHTFVILRQDLTHHNLTLR